MSVYPAVFAIAVKAPHLSTPPFNSGGWNLVYVRQDRSEASARFDQLRQYFRGTGAQIAVFTFQREKPEEVRVAGLFGTASVPKMATIRIAAERYRDRFWSEVFQVTGFDAAPAPVIAKKQQGFLGALRDRFAA